MVAKLGVPPSKTQLLRWIHSDQAPRIMMELSPFLTWPVTLSLELAHQSSKHESFGWGARTSKPKSCRMLNQNCLDKTQEIIRWSIVSSAWSQRGQVAGWGRPLLARRSAVQHLLWATVHMKNLHFPGAPLLQILSQGLNPVAPMKSASYADFVEYWPEAENCQMCTSSTSGCSWKFERSSHSCKYSVKTCRVSAPFISVIQLLSESAAWTVLFLDLGATELNKCGNACARLWPSSHLSVQKEVFLPFPTSVTMAIERNALTCGGAWMEKTAHASPAQFFAATTILFSMPNSSSEDLKCQVPPDWEVWWLLAMQVGNVPP